MTEDIQEGNTRVYSCIGISQEFGTLVEKQEAVKSLVAFPKKITGNSTLQKNRAGAGAYLTPTVARDSLFCSIVNDVRNTFIAL